MDILFRIKESHLAATSHGHQRKYLTLLSLTRETKTNPDQIFGYETWKNQPKTRASNLIIRSIPNPTPEIPTLR